MNILGKIAVFVSGVFSAVFCAITLWTGEVHVPTFSLLVIALLFLILATIWGLDIKIFGDPRKD